jgi:hypothetical protein
MSRCPTCGQECGEPMIAILRDHGFDPLEHCFFLAYYSGKIRECAGRDNPKIMRCCNLCPISKVFGAWKVQRGQQTFVADGSISSEVYA